LQSFQARANPEDDKEKDGKETEEDNQKDDEGDGDDEVRPVDNTDRIFIGLTVFFHLAFIIDLIALCKRFISSGVIVPCLFLGIFFAIWIYYSMKNRNLAHVTESWLLNFRLATILHQFAFLLFFWMSLCSVLIFEMGKQGIGDIGKGEGFFDSMRRLSGEDRSSCALAILLILTIFFSVTVYAVILYVHSRSMWSLDEIASLLLAAKLQANLSDNNGGNTQTIISLIGGEKRGAKKEEIRRGIKFLHIQEKKKKQWIRNSRDK